MAEWDEYTGRLDTKESLEIRVRVSGYLDKVHFEEGKLVKAGDLMFTIDKRACSGEQGTADLFPRVTFGGGIGFSAATLDGLGRLGSDNFAFGPNVSWAFLDSPCRHQLVQAAGARVEGRLETYRQTVLLALEDTENGLTHYGQEQARRAHLGDAVTASANAAKLARQRFEGDTASFLEVLDVERVHLTNEASLAESRKATATHLIRLFKALGGGWNN